MIVIVCVDFFIGNHVTKAEGFAVAVVVGGGGGDGGGGGGG